MSEAKTQAPAMEGWFTMEEVLTGICEKLVRRHPHIFEEAKDLTTEEVLAQWERIKEQEKQQKKEKGRKG